MAVEWFLAGVLVGAVGAWLQQHDRESSDAVDEYLEHRRLDLRDRYETTAMGYVEFGGRGKGRWSGSSINDVCSN